VAAAWVRALSRPVIPMRAPSAARPAAAARPMPPVPPVTSAPSGRGSSQSLKAVPSCELPPSTLNRDSGCFSPCIRIACACGASTAHSGQDSRYFDTNDCSHRSPTFCVKPLAVRYATR
jgi:hypothetical protein